ncbi:YbfB/YjiJ family MFS transporter [Roseibium sp. TrichSKD4]|uniref:YbfB/YjiJ family MFS transporter n=1 Tax=Roseibium sp. TrichSKD4 TaxID=744980 RepID=UPI0005906154|nr:YbfB/YjiJ family MFS transporter [Roseibium sp. TrichSKD4]
MRSLTSPTLLAIGGLLSLAAAMGIGRFVYTPILPFMVDGLNLSADDAGLIASANFLGYLIGALFGAMRGLPGSARSWFLGALFASAATTGLMGTVTSLETFLALRFIGGVASALVLVFSSSLILDRLRTSGKPGLSAVHFAGVGSGIAFSALLIALLALANASSSDLWFAAGGASLLLLLISANLVPAQSNVPTMEVPAPEQGPVSDKLQLDGSLIRLIFAYGLFGFGYVITATFVSVLARTTPDLQPSEPYVWLIVGLAAAPSIFIWNQISERTGARRAIALACLTEAVGVSLTVLSQEPLIFRFGAALLGGTFMGITALGLVEARAHLAKLGTADPRRILALMTASFGLGQMAGPWFAGELYTLTGSFEAPTLCAAAALVVAALLVVR